MANIIEACVHGDFETVKGLLEVHDIEEQKRIIQETIDGEGKSLGVLAFLNKRYDLLRYLNKICNPEPYFRFNHLYLPIYRHLDTDEEIDNIMEAAAAEDENVVFERIKDLVENGKDVNIRGSCLETLLHYACSLHNLRLVGYLFGKGADVNAVTDKLETPIYFLCDSYDFVEFNEEKVQCFGEMIGLLLSYGCDMNFSDISGTPPHVALLGSSADNAYKVRFFDEVSAHHQRKIKEIEPYSITNKAQELLVQVSLGMKAIERVNKKT
jgi:ankyrin repeat protein